MGLIDVAEHVGDERPVAAALNDDRLDEGIIKHGEDAIALGDKKRRLRLRTVVSDS